MERTRDIGFTGDIREGSTMRRVTPLEVVQSLLRHITNVNPGPVLHQRVGDGSADSGRSG